MGRELRRVPADWDHPRDGQGRYVPMFDEAFEDEFSRWHTRLHEWLSGDDEEQMRVDAKYGDYPATAEAFIRWGGGLSDPENFRPAWPDKVRTCYQVYETVSEGTPVSPVFATLGEVIEWWINIGDSFNGRLTREQAERWVEHGSSPSMFYSSETGLVPGAQL